VARPRLVACSVTTNKIRLVARSTLPVPLALNRSRAIALVLQLTMADASREHNSSAMPGVVRNPDPALDLAHEHHHGHLHHGAAAHADVNDDKAYTKGTTLNEPSVIPPQDPNDDALHRLGHPERKDVDIEKSGGGYYEAEQGSLEKDSHTNGVTEEQDPKKHHLSMYYRRYRIFVHIFIGMFFTGYALQNPRMPRTYTDAQQLVDCQRCTASR
jgi:hypothetical protein